MSESSEDIEGVLEYRVGDDSRPGVFLRAHDGALRKLQSGDLVTVFKSVSRGKELWSGTISLQPVPGKRIYGTQQGVDFADWARMFTAHRPARLERNGRVIFGSLDYEEGGWALMDFARAGYAAINYLKDGDRLTVFERIDDGVVAWRGKLDMVPAIFDEQDYVPLSETPCGIDKREWQRMALFHYPARVAPKI